jgi:hypothetical protein
MLETIKKALNTIDFQLNDEDENNFYIYAMNMIYHKDLPYPYEEYRPPRYFKLLLNRLIACLE